MPELLAAASGSCLGSPRHQRGTPLDRFPPRDPHLPLPERQYRRADPRSRDGRLCRHRRAGSGSRPEGARRNRLDAHGYPGDAPASRSYRGNTGGEAPHRRAGDRAAQGPGPMCRRWMSPSPRGISSGSANSKRRSGKRRAIAMTMSATGSPERRSCSPAIPCSPSDAGGFVEGRPESLWRSLERFLPLPDDTEIFSGHDYVLSNARFALAADPDNVALKSRMAEAQDAKAAGRFLVPTTMRHERATNPFLRSTEPSLAKAVNLSANSPAELVFTALRAWKNSF